MWQLQDTNVCLAGHQGISSVSMPTQPWSSWCCHGVLVGRTSDVHVVFTLTIHYMGRAFILVSNEKFDSESQLYFSLTACMSEVVNNEHPWMLLLATSCYSNTLLMDSHRALVMTVAQNNKLCYTLIYTDILYTDIH